MTRFYLRFFLFPLWLFWHTQRSNKGEKQPLGHFECHYYLYYIIYLWTKDQADGWKDSCIYSILLIWIPGRQELPIKSVMQPRRCGDKHCSDDIKIGISWHHDGISWHLLPHSLSQTILSNSPKTDALKSLFLLLAVSVLVTIFSRDKVSGSAMLERERISKRILDVFRTAECLLLQVWLWIKKQS